MTCNSCHATLGKWGDIKAVALRELKKIVKKSLKDEFGTNQTAPLQCCPTKMEHVIGPHGTAKVSEAMAASFVFVF